MNSELASLNAISVQCMGERNNESGKSEPGEEVHLSGTFCTEQSAQALHPSLVNIYPTGKSNEENETAFFNEENGTTLSKKACLFDNGKFTGVKIAVDFVLNKEKSTNSHFAASGVSQRSPREEMHGMLSVVSDALQLPDESYQFSPIYGKHDNTMISSLLSQFHSALQDYNAQRERNNLFLEENKIEKACNAVLTTRFALDTCLSEVKAEREKKKSKKAEMARLIIFEDTLKTMEKNLISISIERQDILGSEIKLLDRKERKYRELWMKIRESPVFRSAFAEQLRIASSGGVMKKNWLFPDPLSSLSDAITFVKEFDRAWESGNNARNCQEKANMAQLSYYITEEDVPQALKLLVSLPLAVVQMDSSMLHRACAVSQPSFELVNAIVGLRPELCKGIDSATGNTALHFLCLCSKALDDDRIFRLLIAAGVPLSHRNHSGQTVFHLLVLNQSDAKRHQIKKLLLHFPQTVGMEKVDVDERTAYSLTALHLVCGNDVYLPTTKFLVKCGADLGFSAPYCVSCHFYGVCRMTPLEKSARCGAVKTHQFLRAALKKTQEDFF